MHDILKQIIIHKKKEITNKQKLASFLAVKKKSLILAKTKKSLSLKTSLTQKKGIIAEFKRKSPSKGFINEQADIKDFMGFYSKASAISILTDEFFFGGTIKDLELAKKITSLPILRKDFIIDEYQIFESKIIGADIILLIAAILDKETITTFVNLAHTIGLEVLLEIHGEDEIDKIDNNVDIIGINNRNLKTFTVNLEHSLKIQKKIDLYKKNKNIVKITESGIKNEQDIIKLKNFNGFLIGEIFMKAKNPQKLCNQFIDFCL